MRGWNGEILMQKVSETDAKDPFAPESEPEKETVHSEEKRKRVHISGYFRISIILGIILWVTDFLIFFLDRWSFVAASSVPNGRRYI